jgi:maltose/moltooligosaccharide transporter
MTPPLLESSANELRAVPGTYRVGSLTYTRAALLNVLFWMLLGDFCLQIMEQLPVSLVPLQLRWAQAADALIGFLSGSLPAFLGMLLNPFVGVQSDRHRGKLGRRRPFLLWSTPVVVLALVGLGYAAPVASTLAEVFGSSDVAAVKIGWIGGCMVVFVIANTYIMQVYQFLFVDVIPSSVMGKFVGCYRAIGALGAFVFHRYMFGQAEERITEIYLLSAVLYAVSFVLLVWNVKEGEYPDPPPKKAGGGKAAALAYFSECFGHSIYWKTYSLSLFFWSAIVPLWTFLVFFGTKSVEGYAPSLGLSLEEFGHIRGWASLISVPVYFLVGPLVDKFHPLRVALIGLVLSALTFFACFVFVRTPASFLLWLNLNMVAQAIYMGSFLAILPRLLPRAKYGQFFTANQLFGFSGVVLAPVLCGWMIQQVKDYRFIFIWCGVCTTLSLIMCVLLYRQWKQLGGDQNYSPPDTSRSA